jgi:hypothetical protein
MITTIYIIGLAFSLACGIYDLHRLYKDLSNMLVLPCAVVFAILWPLTVPLMLIGLLVRRIQ